MWLRLGLGASFNLVAQGTLRGWDVGEGVSFSLAGGGILV